ncbi:MAG: hypothetical protein ACRDZZ_14535, partial [Ilumatobacteraceae bacterium]
MTTWTVVGAGSAGCVVAARLSAEPSNHVILLESGPGGRGAEGASFFDALADPERTHHDLVASRVEGGAPSRYLRGRGLGGSGSVNAMLALSGGPFVADHLLHLEVASKHEWGAVDRALAAAAADAAAVPLTRREGRRETVVDAYLD